MLTSVKQSLLKTGLASSSSPPAPMLAAPPATTMVAPPQHPRPDDSTGQSHSVPTSCQAPEMTEVEPVLDFAASGRSGRRNALPDILGSPAGVNHTDLHLKLAELSLTDGPGGAQSPTSEETPAPTDDSSEGKKEA